MSVRDFDSRKSSQNSSLGDHLKEIEQHTEAAARMVGKQLNLGNSHKGNLLKQKTDVREHLAEIRQHTEAAQHLIGNSTSKPSNPTHKQSQSKDGDNALGIILLVILILLLLGIL